MSNIKSVEGINLRRLRYMLKVSQEDADAGHLDVTKYSHFARILNMETAHAALKDLTQQEIDEMSIWVQQMGTGIIQRLIDEVSLAPEKVRGVSTLVALHAILAALTACIDDYATAHVYMVMLEEQLKIIETQSKSLLQVRSLYNLGKMVGMEDKDVEEWKEIEFTIFKESLAAIIHKKEHPKK